MATAPVKSQPQPLHYFSLPHLKWGQKSHTNTNRRRESPPQTTNNFNGGCSDSDNNKQEQQEGDGQQVKLWNLRPRRGGIMKLVGVGGETAPLNNVVESSSSNNHVQRSQRLKDNNENGNGVGSGKKRKLWISLSREEIEEDVYSMTGSRPSRRPKKRSKNVQKQLDCVFPGLYLVGLTGDSFRVHDTTK